MPDSLDAIKELNQEIARKDQMIRQLEKEIMKLNDELRDEKEHFTNLYNMKLERWNRKDHSVPQKDHGGFWIVSIKPQRASNILANQAKRIDMFIVYLEGPWSNSLPYSTAQKLWEEQAETIVSDFGYKHYYEKPKDHTYDIKGTEAIAFYGKLEYNANHNYRVSFYANQPPAF